MLLLKKIPHKLEDDVRYIQNHLMSRRNEINWKTIPGGKTGLFFPPERGLPHNSTSIVWADEEVYMLP